MLRALLDGQQTPAQMAKLARGRMKGSGSSSRRRSRDGVRMQLGRFEAVEMDIAHLDSESTRRLCSIASNIPG